MKYFVTICSVICVRAQQWPPCTSTPAGGVCTIANVYQPGLTVPLNITVNGSLVIVNSTITLEPW
jgi:hypothetical protein